MVAAAVSQSRAGQPAKSAARGAAGKGAARVAARAAAPAADWAAAAGEMAVAVEGASKIARPLGTWSPWAE